MVLQSWEYGDPLVVAERKELQANSIAKREMLKALEKARIQARKDRIRELVFKGKR